MLKRSYGIIFVILLFAGSAIPGQGHAQSIAGLLVAELFTSQGCSSCLPADELLAEIATTKQSEVLALSYHVDYWNYMGWKDPFSKDVFTSYQHLYSGALGTHKVYTPQMIINGRHAYVGSERDKILKKLFSIHASRSMDVYETTPLRLDIVAGSNEEDVGITIESIYRYIGHDVYLVTYIPSATTEVLRGENKGHTITNHNIVQSRTKIGVMEADNNIYSAHWPKDHQAVVLLQNPRSMAIVGVTILKNRP